MENQLVVNRGAKWFCNVGQFPFTDPTTGVCFQPRTHVQVEQSDWMKGQSVIQEVIAEPEPVKVTAKK